MKGTLYTIAMKKISSVFLLIVLIPQVLFAQKSMDIIEKLSIDTAGVYDRIRNICFQNTMLSNRNDVDIFVFYKFDDNSIHDKMDYVDGSSLDSLSLILYHPDVMVGNSTKSCLFKNRKHVPKFEKDTTTNLLEFDSYTVIDKKGVMLGMGGDICSRCLSVPYDSTMVFFGVGPTSYLYSKKLDFVFRTRNKMYYNYFLYGINKEEETVYVIVDTRYGSEMFTLEEIVFHHWDDFQKGLPELYEEVRERKKAEFEKN